MTTARRAAMLLVLALAWTQTGYNFYHTDDGLPLRWYRDDVPVYIDETLSADLPAEDALAAIRASLETWNRVDCPHPRLQDLGLVANLPPIRKVGSGEEGTNQVIFESGDAWRVGKDLKDQDAIALTTLFYDPTTGEARSYALEMNEDAYRFGVLDGPDGDWVDLANTITHELGHVLALDHSGDRRATMYYSAGNGEIAKRSLTLDDTNGLCSLYDEEYADVNPEAGGGGGGTGCSTGVPTAPLALVPALVALAALASARRRRRSPREP